MKSQIQHVLIAGGTHGDEWTGVKLIQAFLKQPDVILRPSFKTSAIIGNPEAFKTEKRYLDRDLNRSFQKELLTDFGNSDREVQLARNLLATYGPQGTDPADFVMDLHTTTAATGACLILSHPSLINLHFARYLSEAIPNLKVALWGGDRKTGFFKDALPNGVTFEIGPIAQRTWNAEIYFATQAAVLAALDFFTFWNEHPEHFADKSLEVYEPYRTVNYPLDAHGELSAMIHPSVDGKDFNLFSGDLQAFIQPSGKVITIPLDGPSYPMFVGEASYYEKNVAFYLMKKRRIGIANPC